MFSKFKDQLIALCVFTSFFHVGGFHSLLEIGDPFLPMTSLPVHRQRDHLFVRRPVHDTPESPTLRGREDNRPDPHHRRSARAEEARQARRSGPVGALGSGVQPLSSLKTGEK